MRPYHKKRLLKLAAFLDELPPEQFDICSYGHDGECGTVACVAGWAGLIPEFRRAGLKTEFGIIDTTISFKGVRQFPSSNTAGNFLGLTGQESHDLFYQSGYGLNNVGPKDAAAKIRSIVAKHTSRTQKKGA